MGPSSKDTTDTTVEEAFESPPRSFAGLAKAVSSGRTAMVCESPPLDGSARAAGFLDIRGWAYSGAGLEGVDVYLDGLRYDARLGVVRSDLHGLFGVDLTRSGFDLTIELDAGQVGLLAVTVVARGADGHAVGVGGTLECVPEPELGLGVRARDDHARPGNETFEGPAPGGVERFESDGSDRGLLLEAEHDARYGWAAGFVSGREVLDAGCGSGHGTVALAVAGASRVVGVDISDDAIRGARERCGDAVEFVVGDLAELAFVDGSFDVVACFETLAYLSDPERAIDELRRILRPDGVLLLSARNAAAWPSADPLHLHEYRPDDITEMLGRRFAAVGLYRQQSHVASLLCDDASVVEGSSGQELAARVRLPAGGGRCEALHIVAAASDTDLPDMESLVSIGGLVGQESSHDLAWSLRERALIAEAQLAASVADARTARLESVRRLQLLQRAEDGRREVEGSLSWRITRPLRVAKRMSGPGLLALRPARRILGLVRRAAVRASSYIARRARRSRI